MTIHRLFLVLQARWRLAVLVFLATLGLVMVVTWSTKPLYTAGAAVVIDSRAVDAMGSASVNSGATPGYVATQVDIAQSERVVSRAARAMHLDDDAELRERWFAATGGKGDYMAWLSAQIQSRFSVRPARESSAMTLSFSDRDPAFSAAMTNSLMQAYVDTTLELRVEPARQYTAFFDERSRQLRDALEKAQTRLSAYQRESGLLAADERFDVENARLSELSSQVVLMQNAAAESKSRQFESAANSDKMQEILNNPVIASLTTELSRLEARLQELRARLGDNHPQIAEAGASIANLRAKLGAATRAATGSIGVTNSVMGGRLDQARTALEQQRARVLALKTKRDEAAVLQRDVENAQRAYDAVLTRASQSDLESQNRQTNVSILQSATVPPFPSSPKLILNAVVGIFLGVLLAIGACLGREAMDRRLRSEEDVVQLLSQPLLMVLSDAAWSGRKSDVRLAQQKSRVINGRPWTSLN